MVDRGFTCPPLPDLQQLLALLPPKTDPLNQIPSLLQISGLLYYLLSGERSFSITDLESPSTIIYWKPISAAKMIACNAALISAINTERMSKFILEARSEGVPSLWMGPWEDYAILSLLGGSLDTVI
ncbi:uncharacterized protein LOC120155111 isoform X2 [Hibiscus syriacus]|uniref:uncharacterized protein LOC120155111 isoform X2 n=1 Tax=Hibiscus syriacus TaxID=106335 RepID=UPI001922A522|nr:uncharacterized protein LOC120155111 isoform X2 [Hibiscus syriacus]